MCDDDLIVHKNRDGVVGTFAMWRTGLFVIRVEREEDAEWIIRCVFVWRGVCFLFRSTKQKNKQGFVAALDIPIAQRDTYGWRIEG